MNFSTNLNEGLFLQHCGANERARCEVCLRFWLAPYCCKNRLPPGTCCYSNVDPMYLYCCKNRSLGVTCFYSNMKPVCFSSYIPYFWTLQHSRSNLGISSKPEIDQNWKSKFFGGTNSKNFPHFQNLFLANSKTLLIAKSFSENVKKWPQLFTAIWSLFILDHSIP